jgi:hypothetical protein
MMTIKTIPGTADMWRNRLCCECRWFIRTPFSVGKCGRKGLTYPPSITDERAASGSTMFLTTDNETRCGPPAQFFMAKREAA